MLTICVTVYVDVVMLFLCFFFQAEDGIRDLVRSRGLGDVYKRQWKYASSLKVSRQFFGKCRR